jgi:hypothetical protein
MTDGIAQLIEMFPRPNGFYTLIYTQLSFFEMGFQGLQID